MKNFRDELKDLINKHSLENVSDTPDYILADYLVACLQVFNAGVIQRRRHISAKEDERYNAFRSAVKKEGD